VIPNEPSFAVAAVLRGQQKPLSQNKTVLDHPTTYATVCRRSNRGGSAGCWSKPGVLTTMT